MHIGQLEETFNFLKPKEIMSLAQKRTVLVSSRDKSIF